MIISQTPFRISFFGGGTDYPAWYREEPGAVLSTSIDKYCYINCRRLPACFNYRIRIVYTKNEMVNRVEEIQHPAVKECMKYLKLESDLEITHAADLPARTGLGASSSFIVGLLNALHVMRGIHPHPEKLAESAIRIEQDLIGEAVGSQDQIAAAYGGLNRIDFRDHSFAVTPLDLPPERIAALESHLLLYFTGIFRNAPEIAQEQIKHIKDHKSAMIELRGMVDDAIELLKGSGSLSGFGEMLHESWMIKRSLSDKITNPTIDAIYAAAKDAGALGGKLLGAGGGGFMLFFVPPDQHGPVRQRLSELFKVPFRFENGGSQIIFRNMN